MALLNLRLFQELIKINNIRATMVQSILSGMKRLKFIGFIKSQHHKLFLQYLVLVRKLLHRLLLI